MSEVICLNLDGPLQSWAGPALVKTRVDTDRKPSSRALRGMIAACFGVPRGEEYPDAVKYATINVEVLRAGRIIRDFQTIHANSENTGYLERVGTVLASGKKPGPPSWPGSTISSRKFPGVVERTYLGDAQFLVTIKGRDDAETDEIISKIKRPVWTPYLGKRAFPVVFPFLLGKFPEEVAKEESISILKSLEVKSNEKCS